LSPGCVLGSTERLGAWAGEGRGGAPSGVFIGAGGAGGVDRGDGDVTEEERAAAPSCHALLCSVAEWLEGRWRTRSSSSSWLADEAPSPRWPEARRGEREGGCQRDDGAPFELELLELRSWTRSCAEKRGLDVCCSWPSLDTVQLGTSRSRAARRLAMRTMADSVRVACDELPCPPACGAVIGAARLCVGSGTGAVDAGAGFSRPESRAALAGADDE
jgi:hypothetical protein